MELKLKIEILPIWLLLSLQFRAGKPPWTLIKLGDDFIRTTDLWYRKRPLFQLSHNPLARLHSSLGDVSLYGWSIILKVWIQLLHYIQATKYFLLLVKSSLVKLWLIWQSGRLRHQSFGVWMQSSPNFQLYWKDKIEEKGARNGHFKRLINFSLDISDSF